MDDIDVDVYRMTVRVLDRLESMGVEPDEHMTIVARAICEDLAELLASFLEES
jgi:Fe2+ transport system protein FeoA